MMGSKEDSLLINSNIVDDHHLVENINDTYEELGVA